MNFGGDVNLVYRKSLDSCLPFIVKESEDGGYNVTSLRFLFCNVTKSEFKSKFRVPFSMNNTMLENTKFLSQKR